MTHQSNEQAANLLDQIPFRETAVKQKSVQDTNAKPQITIKAAMNRIEVNGFSVLLDHLKAESLKHEKQAQERRQLMQRSAA